MTALPRILLFALLIALPASGPSWPVHIMNQNEYISVKLGVWDDPNINLIPARWSFGAVEGDPETPDDNGGDMIYLNSITPRDSHGYAVVRIQDLGKNVIVGDINQGGWALSPYKPVDGQAVYGEWQLNSDNGSILVKIRIDLRRDMGRIWYSLVNNDSVPHNVGLRIGWDQQLMLNDGAEAAAPGYGSLPGETEYQGTAVPEYIEYFDNLSNPTMICRNLFSAPWDPKHTDMTPPDRVVVAQWGYLVGPLWDYTIIPDRPITDRASSAWWNPITINPNQTRNIVTYFGMGVATSDLRYPYALSVQGPRALKYDESEITGLRPDPFTIKAYLYNFYHTADLSNVSFYLSLPPGLEFKAGETPTKTVASIGPESESRVQWSVKPTGMSAGELVYSVTATGGGVTSKTVRRIVVVPITQTLMLSKNLQMLSLPFNFDDPTPETALGLTSGDVTFYQFDPSINNYVTVDTLTPGMAFWLRADVAQNINLVGATPMAGDSTFQIPLRVGWNQFGNPYVYCLSWGRVKVLYERSGLGPVTIESATQRGWIRPTIYWYDIASKNYGRSSDRKTQLVPGRGYWIRANVPCKLVIPPIDQLGAEIITM